MLNITTTILVILCVVVSPNLLCAEDFLKQDERCRQEWSGCTQDSDCVIIQKRCELIVSVNKMHASEAEQCLVQHEMAIDCAMGKVYLDEELHSVCEQGSCQIVKDNTTKIGELWDTQ